MATLVSSLIASIKVLKRQEMVPKSTKSPSWIRVPYIGTNFYFDHFLILAKLSTRISRPKDEKHTKTDVSLGSKTSCENMSGRKNEDGECSATQRSK